MPNLHLAPELWDLIYPVGSEFKTFDSTFDPNSKFNGTWTKYYEGKDYIPIGDALLYPGTWRAESGPYGPIMVRQAYNKQLLAGCLGSTEIMDPSATIKEAVVYPTPPTGYKIQIQFSAAISTGGGNEGRIRLNGLDILAGLSWSTNTFKPVNKSRFFDLDEITVAPLNQYGGSYSGQGLCLMFQNALSNNWCEISEVTAHGYFTSIDTCYKWRRVS